MNELDFNMRQLVVQAYNMGRTIDELHAEFVAYNRVTGKPIPGREVIAKIYEEIKHVRTNKG